jgi:hypothetical protein
VGNNVCLNICLYFIVDVNLFNKMLLHTTPEHIVTDVGIGVPNG